jgi:uncharacterized membrane protein SirB2
VLVVNAVLAVAIGCSLYIIRFMLQRTTTDKETANVFAVPSAQ